MVSLRHYTSFQIVKSNLVESLVKLQATKSTSKSLKSKKRVKMRHMKLKKNKALMRTGKKCAFKDGFGLKRHSLMRKI
jgi:hypothetical protein